MHVVRDQAAEPIGDTSESGDNSFRTDRVWNVVPERLLASKVDKFVGHLGSEWEASVGNKVPPNPSHKAASVLVGSCSPKRQ